MAEWRRRRWLRVGTLGGLLPVALFAVLPSCTGDDDGAGPAPSVVSTTATSAASSTTTAPRHVLVADEGRVTFDPAPQGFEVREDPPTGTDARRIKVIAFGQRDGDSFLVAVHRGPNVGIAFEGETDRDSGYRSERGRSYREADGVPNWRLLGWVEDPDVVVYVNSTTLDFVSLAAMADTITISG